MSAPRRRLIRPSSNPLPAALQHTARLQKLRQKLAKEQAALARWMSRLKRSFHSSQASVARLQRSIAKLEE
jgi:hypothetical protein